MSEKVYLFIHGVTIAIKKSNWVIIKIKSDGSEIEIPYTIEDGSITGVVPVDAKGHWMTLRGQRCSFIEEVIAD